VNAINANFAVRDRWRTAGGNWSHDPRHQRGVSTMAAAFGGGAAHVPWRSAPARTAPQLAQSPDLPPRVSINPPARSERHDRGSNATLPPPVSAPATTAAAPQFRSAPTTQFRNAPTTHFTNAPTTQFHSAPTTHFDNAPTTHFHNAPTQFRAAPATPAPLAHVAPSHPALTAHVAPSSPAPTRSSSTDNDRHHH